MSRLRTRPVIHCLNCGKEILKPQRKNCSRSCRNKWLAKSGKIWGHVGKTLSEDAKRRIAKSVKQNALTNPNYGMRGKHHSDDFQFGRRYSDETKQKMRLSKIRYSIESGWDGQATLGRQEKELLDKQEQLDNCKILRQFHIEGYIVDGYCPETNTVYEVYEPFHERQIEKDRQRQQRIQDKLECKFVVLNG